MTVQIHPTAIVDDGATVGEQSKIWHWVHVSAGASIGSNCSLGQNVFIANGVTIGNNVRIQNNVSVYDGVTLEDDVFCGPSMVFTNVINPRSQVSRKDEYRKTVVRIGASIGANATIICGLEIGKYAFIGAGAVVTKTVPDFALMVGNPARQIGWMSRHGERLKLPVDGVGTESCEHSQDVYSLSNGVLTLTDRDILLLLSESIPPKSNCKYV